MNDTSRNLPSRMLALKDEYLIPCVYHFYQHPMVLVRGAGAYLHDDRGKTYLDCYSGVGVANCGHCNPEIVAAAQGQLGRLQHTTTIYLTEPMLRLAERLSRFVPGPLRRSFFCTSGSEANEGALLLARLATGRPDFIALNRSLHGRTHQAAGVTGLPFWRSDPYPPGNVHFIASPVCGECPWGLQHPACGLRCAEEAERVLDEAPGRVAALIAEPIHGNGGIIVPPAGYLTRIREILTRHGVLLIMDEAQTGFCRTGRRFGFEHESVAPDILTVCKALGNGLPISAFMTTDAIAETYSKPGASTFGGNLVCAEAALATLRFMEEHRLDACAEEHGVSLRGRLLALSERFPLISEVRGRGLMLGMELRRDDGAAAAGELDHILETLKELGVLAGKTGPQRNVLTLMPPLIVTAPDIDGLCQKLARAFESACEI